MSEDVDGTAYVDFERIKKHDGYVYWWDLVDLLKPDEYGDLSGKGYVQGDCKKFRYKNLSWSFHKGSMGGGEISSTHNIPNKDWNYPSPDSAGETILKPVCQYAR